MNGFASVRTVWTLRDLMWSETNSESGILRHEIDKDCQRWGLTLSGYDTRLIYVQGLPGAWNHLSSMLREHATQLTPKLASKGKNIPLNEL